MSLPNQCILTGSFKKLVTKSNGRTDKEPRSKTDLWILNKDCFRFTCEAREELNTLSVQVHAAPSGKAKGTYGLPSWTETLYIIRNKKVGLELDKSAKPTHPKLEASSAVNMTESQIFPPCTPKNLSFSLFLTDNTKLVQKMNNGGGDALYVYNLEFYVENVCFGALRDVKIKQKRSEYEGL